MSRIQAGVELLRFLTVKHLRGFDVPEAPHLDPSVSAWFASRMASAKMYLEFGSGGSTILAGGRGVRTISVESDANFARAIRKALPPQNRVTIINVNIGWTRAWGLPIFRRPSPSRLRRWRRYSEAPFEIIEQEGIFPDLVLIDGRFRRACALETTKRCIQSGSCTTILFDDYVRRTQYHSVEEFLGTPMTLERAAIFEVGRGISRLPNDDAFAEANRDFL